MDKQRMFYLAFEYDADHRDYFSMMYMRTRTTYAAESGTTVAQLVKDNINCAHYPEFYDDEYIGAMGKSAVY